MARSVLLIFLCFFFVNIISLPPQLEAISSCNGPCRTLNDWEGQLICINGKCNDDPDVGTHICSSGGDSCQPSGSLTCRGRTYPTYTCSPQVTSATPAKLTNNEFSEGGDDAAHQSATTAITRIARGLWRYQLDGTTVGRGVVGW